MPGPGWVSSPRRGRPRFPTQRVLAAEVLSAITTGDLTRTKRLWVVLGLNVVLIGALAAVGVTAHSLGVLAEGADYLADAAGIGVALVAIRLAGRPPTLARPNGYPNATAWAALVNASWLLLLTILVAAAAIDRLVSGTRAVHGLPVLIVSSIAAVVMFGGAVLLGGDEDDDDDAGNLNMRAVLLDTAADAAAAATVAVTGAIILAAHGRYWLDPAVALLVSVAVAYHAIKLLRRVVVTLRGHPRN